MEKEISHLKEQFEASTEHPLSFLKYRLKIWFLIIWQKTRFGRDFFKEVYLGTFFKDNIATLAAAISFYTVLSILPLALLFVSVSAYVLKSSEKAFLQVADFLVKVFPTTTASAFNILTSLISHKKVFGVVGLLGLAWAASRIFGVTEGAMNLVWQAPRGRSWWQSKLLSLILVPLALVALIVSVSLTSVYSLAQHKKLPIIQHSIADFPLAGKILAIFIPIFLGFILFWIAYRILPNRRVPWRAAAFGAIIAGALWELCKYGFDLYIKRFADYPKVYGAYAAIVVTVVWIYLSAYILLVGAEVGIRFENVRQRRRVFWFFRRAIAFQQNSGPATEWLGSPRVSDE